MKRFENSFVLRLVIFLLINFGALAIGSFFTNDGSDSEWYRDLEKAPWNPPGWMFGFAWTTIMICFSIYMALLWTATENKKQLAVLFCMQWILNVSWNPAFFYYHQVLAGLIIITALTFLVGFFLFNYYKNLKLASLLLLPYFIWLLIATSLNGYILFNN